MARIRTIKPDFFRHEGLFEAEQETGFPLRLAFAGLFTVSDREGCFRWLPRQIKLDVMPYDNVDFSRVLDALATRGFVVRYACGTDEYGVIPSFTKHQVINNREKSSGFPQLQDAVAVWPYENNDLVTRAPRVDDACPTPLGQDQAEWKGREGKGKEGEGKGKDACAELFARFWSLYPNRKGKADAEKAWSKLKPTDELFSQICEGLAKQVTCYDWTKDGGKFIPHPATWLNGKRWTDEVKLETKPLSVHGGFDDRDYNDGLITREDGSLGL